jgi:glycerol-3-phosphate acyltransferase PlsX
VLAARQTADLSILLFGQDARLRPELARFDDAGTLPIQLIDAPEVIEMGDSPVAAVKHKQGSSIHLGLAAHKGGQADAFVSAGNTGAVMAAALFILGRLPGVSRPSIIGFFPTTRDYCIVLDVGSNVDCKPEHLVEFALMGAVYAERIMKRPNPVVALLNIGEEPGKGDELSKAAYKLLSEARGFHFRGNVEGRDILTHAADVIICDGFVGNALLKFGESIASALPLMLKQEMDRQELDANEQQLVGRVFHGVKARFDYEEYGGGPLLGVNGHVLIGHGGSSARAISCLIQSAAKVAARDVAGSIAAALAA